LCFDLLLQVYHGKKDESDLYEVGIRFNQAEDSGGTVLFSLPDQRPAERGSVTDSQPESSRSRDEDLAAKFQFIRFG